MDQGINRDVGVSTGYGTNAGNSSGVSTDIDLLDDVFDITTEDETAQSANASNIVGSDDLLGYSDDFSEFEDDFDGQDDLSDESEFSQPLRLTPLSDSTEVEDDSNSLFDFTPEQLTQLGLNSDDEEIAQNDFSIKVVELTSNNYINVEQLDDENLDKLYNFSFKIQDSDAITSSVMEYFGRTLRAIESLSVTEATAVSGLYSTNSSSEEFLHRQLLQNTAINNNVNAIIESILRSKREPTAQEIIQRLVSSSNAAGSVIIDANVAELTAALPAYIKAYKTFIANREKAITNTNLYRNSVATYLLRDEVESLQKMFAVVKENTDNVSIIRQIKKGVDGKLSVVCDKCGEDIPLATIPAKIICFPTEQHSSARLGYIIGLPMTCKCGHHYIFYHETLSELMDSFDKENKKSYENAKESVRRLAPGAAILKIHVSSSDIENALPYMIYSSDTEQVTTEQHTVEKQRTIPLVPSLEIKQAAERFYRRIPALREMYNDIFPTGYLDSVKHNTGECVEGSTGSDSNHDVALYLCSALGKDYKVLRNQALFSLISAFKEDPLLSRYLFRDTVWYYENVLADIRALPEDYNKISDQQKKNIIGYCASILQNITEETLQSLNAELFFSLVHDLESSVKKLIQEHNTIYENIIDKIKANFNWLSYCKIVNMSNFPLHDIESFLVDENMLQLCNKLVDSMIIVNLSDGFYSFWKNLQIVNRSKLTSTLETAARSDEVGAGLKSILKSIVAIGQLDHADVTDLATVTFSECRTSMDSYEAMLVDLYRVYKDQNIYDFCSMLNEICSARSIFRDYNAKEAIKNIRSLLVGVCEDVSQMSRAGYYLREFSSEELSEASAYVDHFKFTPLVPKRQGGEDVMHYLSRYKEFRGSDTKVEYTNYAEPFNDIVAEVVPLLAGSFYASFRSEASSGALFMIALVDLVLNNGGASTMSVLGMHNRLARMLGYGVDLWDSNRIHVAWFKDTYRILNGFYETSITDAIRDLFSTYDHIIVNNYDDLNTLSAKWDIYKELTVLEGEENYGIHSGASDDLALNDKTEAIAELLKYLSDTELRKIFELYL